MLKIISGGSAYGARLITDQPLQREEVIYHIINPHIREMIFETLAHTVEVDRRPLRA